MKKKTNKKEDAVSLHNSTIDVSSIVRRIKNVQGQLGGVSRMVENGEDCVSVVTQMKAARAGIEKVLELFLEANLRNCISSSLSKKKKEEVEKILSELTK